MAAMLRDRWTGNPVKTPLSSRDASSGGAKGPIRNTPGDLVTKRWLFPLLLSYACAPDTSPAPSERIGKTIAALEWAVQALVLEPDIVANNHMGCDVALQGDDLIVGDYYEGPGQQGAAYFFQRSGSSWVFQQKLEALQQESRFGESLDLDGDTFITAAPYENVTANDQGAAYVWQRSGGVWSLQHKIIASDGSTSHQFGTDVAISGDVVAISTKKDDDVASDAGAVYLFSRSMGAWSFDVKLTAFDGASKDEFGYKVALDGNTLVVGARAHNAQGVNNAGAAYVFVDNGGWALQAKLEQAVPSIGANLGHCVDVDGDTLILGANHAGGSATGSAYVFTRNGSTWTEQAELASPPETGAEHGYSCAVQGDTAVVGAPKGGNTGRAYVYSRSGTTWTQGTLVQSPTPAADDFFGASVALDAGRFVVGSLDEDDGAANAGAAWVFAYVGQACVNASECSSGACADGFCCNVACDAGCGLCDVVGSEGVCSAVPQGEPGNPGCGNFLCDGTFDCPTMCTEHADCIAGVFCDNADCVSQLLDGAACESNEGCASGSCADGRCCDVDCDGQCEACNIPGYEGTCSLVYGQPYPGHTLCPADTCQEGVGMLDWVCDGDVVCEPRTQVTCEPFACDVDRCYPACLSDEHCAEGYDCRLSDGSCVSVVPACEDDVLHHSDGSTSDCSPYRCTDLGTCRESCTSSAACSSGAVCSSDGRCIERPSPPSEPSGCSYHQSLGSRAPWWLTLLGLPLLRRRRQRSR